MKRINEYHLLSLGNITNKYEVSSFYLINNNEKYRYLVDTNTKERIFDIPFKRIQEARNNRTLTCFDDNNNFYYIDAKEREILLKLNNNKDYIINPWYGNSRYFDIPYLWLKPKPFSTNDMLIYDLRTKECVLQLYLNTCNSYNTYNSYTPAYLDPTNNFKDEEGLKKFKMKCLLEGILK